MNLNRIIFIRQTYLTKKSPSFKPLLNLHRKKLAKEDRSWRCHFKFEWLKHWNIRLKSSSAMSMLLNVSTRIGLCRRHIYTKFYRTKKAHESTMVFCCKISAKKFSVYFVFYFTKLKLGLFVGFLSFVILHSFGHIFTLKTVLSSKFQHLYMKLLNSGPEYAICVPFVNRRPESFEDMIS